MAAYSGIFDSLGLSEWCDESKTGTLLSLKQIKGEIPAWWELPFPSLDNLHAACAKIPQSRDLTAALESGFLAIKPVLQFFLDPLTQPLSWTLEAALWLFTALPWWVLVPLILGLTLVTSISRKITGFVAFCLIFFLFTDHYTFAIETLSIIFVCAMQATIFGVPVGIVMAKSNWFQRVMIPVLDTLQTLPPFVYLIPLIFLFDITEPKLYGLAVILFAIVPVIRLTDLGIRLVDPDVIEAADAYGMNARQKLLNVEVPLALPNIMAGVNQTIMLSLSMVVIASLVAAPGLGTLVLDGINNLRLGVGLFAGLCIVLLAIILDRVSKAGLDRINKSHKV
jgi:glycine betaine/proline transport system permease protein